MQQRKSAEILRRAFRSHGVARTAALVLSYRAALRSAALLLCMIIIGTTGASVPAAGASDGYRATGLRKVGERATRQLYLVIESGRLVAYAPNRKNFAEVRLQGNERVRDTLTTEAIAIALTTHGYLGVGARSYVWSKVTRIQNERTLEFRAEDSAAIVVTSHRVLTFDGRNWTRRNRPRGHYP